MIGFTLSISKTFALDLIMFNKIRNLSDGIDFFNCHLSADWYKDDHKPSFDFMLILFNITIIELNIYNKNHLGGSDLPSD